MVEKNFRKWTGDGAAGVVVYRPTGFVALAIDGIFTPTGATSKCRDTGSLAGASAAAMYLENYYVNYEDFDYVPGVGCVSSDPITVDKLNEAIAAAEAASIARVGTNDFTIDENISDDNGVLAACGGKDNGTWIDKSSMSLPPSPPTPPPASSTCSTTARFATPSPQ
jgi:hypothetical protein